MISSRGLARTRRTEGLADTLPAVDACPICDKHRGVGPLIGEVIWEDATVLASHAPAVTVNGYLGYLFVETRRHVPGLAALSDAEATAIARVVSALARGLESTGAELVYEFVFDHMPHHHVHVVARHPGAPREYWGTRIDEWPQAPRGGESDIQALCQRLRASLATDAVYATYREA